MAGMAWLGSLLSRLVRHGSAPRAALLYHRVVDMPVDSFGLCIRPRDFEDHLDVLRRSCKLMALSDLLTEGDDNDRRCRIAVTFDDGYADNFHEALPLLEKYQVPATFFITAGCLGRNEEFWWDALERIIVLETALPAYLDLTVNQVTRRWQCDGSAPLYLPGTGQEGEQLAPRLRLLVELLPHFRASSEAQQQDLLAQLRRQTGVPAPGRPTHRTLTTAELSCLAASPLASVASHTLTHPVLAQRTLGEQRDELGQSRDVLEALIGKPVETFAYPHGQPGLDYSAETVALVRAAGYQTAWTTLPSLIPAQPDLFQIPRLIAPRVDGEGFCRWLQSWTSSRRSTQMGREGNPAASRGQ